MKSVFKINRLAAFALASLLAVGGCSSDTPQSFIASGKEFQAKKDHQAAVIQFKSALQLDPESADARLLLGQALLDAGDPAGAVLEISKVLEQSGTRETALPLLARALLMAGDYRKLTTQHGDAELTDKVAQASLKTSLASAWGVLGNREKADAALGAALAAKPDFGPALTLKARQLAASGNVDAALALLDDIVQRDASLYEAWYLKGDILAYRKNDTQAAEVAFRNALAADTAYVPAYLALVSMRMREGDTAGMEAQAEQMRAVLPKHPQMFFVDAQIAFHKGDLVKARETVQLLLRASPNHLGVLQLAGAIEAQSGSLVMAERYYSKALSISPDLPQVRQNLAQVYLKYGQPEQALATIQPQLDRPTAAAEDFALAGQAHLMLGDSQAAELAFKRAATFAPDDPRIRTALALARLARGETEAAFAQLQAIAASDKGIDADMAIVSARLKRREFDQALKAIDNMDRKLPDNAAMASLRGRVHLARGDNAAARQAFELAVTRNPADLTAVSSLIALDVAAKRPDAAQKRLEAAIAANPSNMYARMALAEFRARSGADIEELKQILTEAIKISPGSPEPQLHLIDLLGRKGQFKEALAAAQEAAAAFPSETRVLDVLGIAQMQAGDTQQAVTTFRRIAGTDTRSALPHVRLADIYKTTRDPGAAEASLKRALELEPGLEAAQLALMELLLSQNRNKDALDVAKRIEAQRPTDAAGYLFEGAIHRRSRAPDAAIAAYRTGLAKTGAKSSLAVQLHKTLVAEGRGAEADRFAAAWVKDQPQDVAFEYQLAMTAVVRGDLAQAQTRLEAILSTHPNNPLALNNLAWVLAVQGKPGAVGYAQRAVDSLPKQAALVDTLAMALAADKQMDQALATQKNAVELAPDNMNLRLNLARIALQAGDKDLARKELERLQTVGKAFPQQAEVAKLMKTL